VAPMITPCTTRKLGHPCEVTTHCEFSRTKGSGTRVNGLHRRSMQGSRASTCGRRSVDRGWRRRLVAGHRSPTWDGSFDRFIVAVRRPPSSARDRDPQKSVGPSGAGQDKQNRARKPCVPCHRSGGRMDSTQVTADVKPRALTMSNRPEGRAARPGARSRADIPAGRDTGN